jgi:NAD(P)-dependent dehydrogenase (short-subunit alcohol dehydrogenase family)
MAAFHTTAQSAAPLYSITKEGTCEDDRNTCVEWAGRNINVNAIAPGFFSSEMTDGMLERIGDITPTLNRKRIPTAEQMDSTLLFLLSPSSECVTGTCIKD